MKNGQIHYYAILNMRLVSRGRERMTFLKDNLWSETKKIAKSYGMADNWVEIVDYYNEQGGCHVLVYVIIDDVKYRILRVDDKDRVVVLDRDNNLLLKEYDLVYSKNKQFFYNETALKEHIVTLPTTCSIQGATEIKIYS